MKLTLPLPVPLNQMYKRSPHSFYKSEKAKDWTTEALWLIKEQKRGQSKPVGDTVYIDIFIKDKRLHDLDNFIKPILDVLQESTIIKNDNDVTFLEVQKKKDSKSYCVVEVI